MKNWLTIGQFAQRAGFTPKALRLYEKLGLIVSHARGENDYRYYDESQLETAGRIKELKDLGFSLNETKDLLNADRDLNSTKLEAALSKRRELINAQADLLQNQKFQVEKILSSLRHKSTPLEAEDRRAIMSFYGNVSIVVTGTQALEKTADYIQEQFQKNKKSAPVFQWRSGLELPKEKPYILICPEENLDDVGISEINGDIIVIRNLSRHDAELKKKYLRLFASVGPHMNTVINADDLASVDLVADETIRKTRYTYYSKNGDLKPQLKNIGGVLSDGDEVEVYGFNLKSKTEKFKLGKILPFEDEVSYSASVGAILTLDFEPDKLAPL